MKCYKAISNYMNSMQTAKKNLCLHHLDYIIPFFKGYVLKVVTRIHTILQIKMDWCRNSTTRWLHYTDWLFQSDRRYHISYYLSYLTLVVTINYHDYMEQLGIIHLQTCLFRFIYVHVNQESHYLFHLLYYFCIMYTINQCPSVT